MSYTPPRGEFMKMTRLIATIALLTAATACTTERVLAPQPAAASFATTLAPPQIPLLFVVDGVKYQRDQVPELSADEVSQVRVVKGRAALKEFGPEASYGVVVITTRNAVGPRT
jgi:hypothetical protein